MDTLSGRIAAVSLGLTSWLVALATFLFAIGFLAGLPLAPFHLEGPLAVPPWHALALDGLLLVGLVAAVLLAAGRSHRARLLMVSAVALLLMAFWQPLGGETWQFDNPSLRLVLSAAFGLGAALLAYALVLADVLSGSGLVAAWRRLPGGSARAIPALARGLRGEARLASGLGVLLCAWGSPAMGVAHLGLALLASLVVGWAMVRGRARSSGRVLRLERAPRDGVRHAA